jgi:hypothetical protein
MPAPAGGGEQDLPSVTFYRAMHRLRKDIQMSNQQSATELAAETNAMLARKFAEAHFEQVHRYKDEIRQLRQMLWAAAASQEHGEFKISESVLVMAGGPTEPNGPIIKTYHDRADRCYVMRAVYTRRRPDGGWEEYDPRTKVAIKDSPHNT